MQTKSTLKVLGTLLFLLGVFGYIFPHWQETFFTNNENLFHVLTGFGAIMFASASTLYRRYTFAILMVLYLALGIYGFTLKQPSDFHIKRVTAQLDLVDNIIHLGAGLAFGWFWLRNRQTA